MITRQSVEKSAGCRQARTVVQHTEKMKTTSSLAARFAVPADETVECQLLSAADGDVVKNRSSEDSLSVAAAAAAVREAGGGDSAAPDRLASLSSTVCAAGPPSWRRPTVAEASPRLRGPPPRTSDAARPGRRPSVRELPAAALLWSAAAAAAAGGQTTAPSTGAVCRGRTLSAAWPIYPSPRRR